jgi:DNA-binding XRE family transcriptional regulator
MAIYTVAEIQKEKDKIAGEFLMLRKTFLLTQAALAEDLKMSRRAIQLIENGRHLPRMSTLKRLRDLKAELAREREVA